MVLGGTRGREVGMAVRASALEYIAVTDATGERRELPRYPRRIVSLAPSVTQTLIDLGLDAEIVGVTKGCPHPRDRMRNAEKLGSPKDPDIGAIVDLMPDLVLMDLEQNRAEDLARLVAGTVPVFATQPRSLEEAVAGLETIGILVDREEPIGKIASAIRREIEESRAWTRGRQRVRMACLLGRDPYVVAGSGGFLADLLDLHGMENVFGHRGDPMVTIDVQDLVTAAPTLILLSSEPFRFRSKHRADLLEVSDIPAAREGRIHLIEGAHLFSQGTRLLRTLPYLREFFGRVMEAPKPGAEPLLEVEPPDDEPAASG